MKKFVFALALVAGSLFAAGCDKASSAGSAAASGAKGVGDKVGDVAKEGMDKAKEGLEKAQKELTDKFDLKGVETAIGKLPADKMAAAKAKWDEFNTMLKDFKAAPMEKMGEWKEKLMKAFDELKKLAGL